MSDIPIIQTPEKPFLGIVPREPEQEPLTGTDQLAPGFLGEVPDGEFWFTIKVKPGGRILRLYQHLGEGRGREAPIVYDKLRSGLRELSWVLGDIMEAPENE
jgi:hypothetical protein